MNKLPDYINCENKEIEHCDFYMTRACKNTCAYAGDIGVGWVGSMVDNPERQNIKKTLDKLFQEDMDFF